MWVPWLSRSSRRVHKTPSNLDFRCNSFRDVESLIGENDDDFSGASSPERPPSPVHRSSIYRRFRRSTSALRAWSSNLSSAVRHHFRPPPDAYNRIVVYYTSLRVVRRTFEDCRAVRSLLKSFRVKIDERDLSMDSSFLAELQEILDQGPLTLPRVFIDGKYIGGADEIRALHESGDLKRMIGRLPIKEPEGACWACGGHRFVLCARCRGSHKVYTEEKSCFSTCDSCNHNGLIKCPACTSVHF